MKGEANSTASIIDLTIDKDDGECCQEVSMRNFKVDSGL